MSKKKSEKNTEPKMPKYLVEFTDKKSEILKKYTIFVADEKTGWEWVERQRDVFINNYKNGVEGFEVNPRSWKAKLVAA